MNKQNFVEKIKKYILTSSVSNGDVFHATTNIQEADENYIVFYRLFENEKSIETFKNRATNKKVGLLVTTIDCKSFHQGDYIQVKASDFVEIQKIVCDEIYKNKGLLKLIGITGTNGKTTVANLAENISNNLGVKSFSIGTLGVMSNGKSIYPEINATTPSYIELRKIINKFQDDYKALFFEVSSHALEQQRLYDLKLDAAGWTSFSQDHLDYHGTLESYFSAKCLVAKSYLKEGLFLTVPNAEVELQKSLSSNGVVFKKAKTFSERNLVDIPFGFKIEHNKRNLELALDLVSEVFGKDYKEITKLKLPEGRFTSISFKENNYAVIDYAHTPDALEKICSAIKESYPTSSLTVVFGCGGDRDRKKRPLMGEAVSKFSDKIIVTSDNPRTEDPMQIINDTVVGIKGDYTICEKRAEAIERAIKESLSNEIILIAGKGHETYQEINGVKHDFSDIEEVKKVIKNV